jgi:precorrin-6A/cobalt-precorrin-6A reductase
MIAPKAWTEQRGGLTSRFWVTPLATLTSAVTQKPHPLGFWATHAVDDGPRLPRRADLPSWVVNGPVLVLAGTTEATELAGRLAREGIDVVHSEDMTRTCLPGRVAAVVDATHPFAEPLPVDRLCAGDGFDVPYVRLTCEPWRPQPGDRWTSVVDLGAAAEAVRRSARRVFLTLDPGDFGAFAPCREQWFLARSVQPPPALPPQSLVIHEREPFSVEREVELLSEHFIDTVVTRNVGGQGTIAKLEAARSLEIDVVMVERPPGVDRPTVTTVDGALEWLQTHLDS